MNQISADKIATELAGLEERGEASENARYKELVWFIQWWSWQPGGLEAMAAEIVAAFAGKIGTKLMRALPQSGKWTLDQCLEVWEETGDRVGPKCRWMGRGFDDWYFENILGNVELEPGRQRSEKTRKMLEQGCRDFNREFFTDSARESVRHNLPCTLEAICNGYGGRRLVEFDEMPTVLFAYMDRHAEKALSGLGKNRVTDLVFRRLRFAQEEKECAVVLGDSRTGKTKSISTWVAMRPGLARLVTVPESSREWELFAAHADALGLPYRPNTSVRVLKRSVEFVLRHSGMFICYDEAQSLFPNRYSRNTPPQRLNWVRCQVIDRGVGCAFFATRQTYHTTMEKFVRATQFQMEQWTGRVSDPLILPAELDHTELLAGAAAEFPQMDKDLLDLIVQRCVQRESGFQHLRPLVKYTYFLAKEAGRAEPILEDVDQALSEFLSRPAITTAPPRAPRRTSAPVPPKRITSPAPAQDSQTQDDFSVRSLQPTCPATSRDPGGIELKVAGP